MNTNILIDELLIGGYDNCVWLKSKINNPRFTILDSSVNDLSIQVI